MFPADPASEKKPWPSAGPATSPAYWMWTLWMLASLTGRVHRRFAGALEHAAAHPQPVAIGAGQLVIGQPVAADFGDRDVQNLQAVDVAVTGDPVHIGR